MQYRHIYGLLLVLIIWPFSLYAKSLNGFNLDNAQVPLHLIQKGGPPRDGIPALITPDLIPASQANYLQPDDPILGIEIQGQTKAYPIRILNWHELVNDQIANIPFVISYCPLCGSGMAFESVPDTSQIPSIANKSLSFGVSGLLFNSDVLMYDRQTGSLWSQIHGKSIAGKLAGTKLKQIPLTLTRWSDWAQRHPESLVLSTNTGYRRNYSRDPYAGYGDNPVIYFPVANKAPKHYHPKEMVLGFKGQSSVIAFPFSELRKNDQAFFEHDIEGELFTIHWDKQNQSAWVTDEQGKVLPSTLLFWFAWYAFYPDTEVYKVR